MRLARWFLGILLVAMAAGQLSNPGGFADVLATYRALPAGWTLPAALALAAAELAAGTGLLWRGPHRARAAGLAVGVAVVWSALAMHAFVRGLVLGNCGCFGVHLAQPLWWGVLVQDAWFIASAVLVGRSLRRPAEAEPQPQASLPMPATIPGPNGS